MENSNVIGISLRDFLHIIFKHKIWIISFFCVTVILVAAYTLMQKPSYTASSQILVKVGRENLYVPTVPTMGNSNPVISLNHEEQINSEIEILKSRSLADRVIESIGPGKIYDMESDPDDRYSLADRAGIRFLNNLEVAAVRKSDIIQVDFKHHDPVMAANVVNTLVDFYFDRHVEVHKNPKSLQFFESQSGELRNALRKSEQNLEDFKKKHQISSLENERRLLLQQESDLRNALNRTQSQEAETERRINQLRIQLAETPRTIPQEEEVEHNPQMIRELQVRLIELELEEKSLLMKYTEQNGLVQNVREEIAIVRNKLAEQEKKRYGKSRTGLNTTFQRLQQLLYENEAEHFAMQAKREVQTSQLAGFRQSLDKLNQIEVELNQLEQRVDVDRQNYRLYLTKFEESRISDAMDTERIANVRLIEPAKPPIKPIGPKVLLNLLLAVVLGFFGALVSAFVLEYLDDSLERPEDVEDYLQVPVLGSIPDLQHSRAG